MFKYYGYFFTNSNLDDYMKIHTVARLEITKKKITSQLFDLETNTWAKDYSVYGRVTGLETDYNYKEISESQAMDFVIKRLHEQ